MTMKHQLHTGTPQNGAQPASIGECLAPAHGAFRNRVVEQNDAYSAGFGLRGEKPFQTH
jgi:hypothetical protein